MVFLQPVAVNDAHAADQSRAAEVRVIDRRALEQPVWTGTMLAQGGMDQRSPFGNNAPTNNELTPTPRMVHPDDVQSGPNGTGNGAGQAADVPGTTTVLPGAGQPDAGPPPPTAGSTATPGSSPTSTAPTLKPAPAEIIPQTNPSDVTPGTTPGSGAGAKPPVVPDSRSVPVQTQPVESPSSSTFPGASSGASNSQ